MPKQGTLVVFTSTIDIAAKLFVSVNTAKTHLHSVYRKLGATNRKQALLRASALGLIRVRDRPERESSLERVVKVVILPFPLARGGGPVAVPGAWP